ncbi:MAG: hypothetical protein PWP65_1058 [Clostridia bacterium]|nr:hypothetical protein [Clostridia bacterium]
MAWHNWLSYLPGYLLLEIGPRNGERFLNLALARGVALWDIHRRPDGNIEAKMRLSDYKVLRELARQGRCRIRIKDKQGLAFWWRSVRRRQLLLLGGVFFCLALWLLSNFIWVVEVRVKGELKQLSRAQILQAAAAEGLKPAAWKPGLDIRALEYGIGRRLPQLAWVGIIFAGTKAEIEVVEKIALPEEDRLTGPAHIVASKDGLIQELVVLAGEARVKIGETVRRGEILISGIILPSQEGKDKDAIKKNNNLTPRLVRARGIVRARVWYEKDLTAPLVIAETRLTGRKAMQVKLAAGGKEFLLKGPPQIPFSSFEVKKKVFAPPSWGHFNLPAELIILHYQETLVRNFHLTPERAAAAAGEKALAELKNSLPAGARVLKERIIILPSTQKDEVKVRVLLETSEDIGAVAPL